MDDLSHRLAHLDLHLNRKEYTKWKYVHKLAVNEEQAPLLALGHNVSLFLSSLLGSSWLQRSKDKQLTDYKQTYKARKHVLFECGEISGNYYHFPYRI